MVLRKNVFFKNPVIFYYEWHLYMTVCSALLPFFFVDMLASQWMKVNFKTL